ncbi:MAG: DUF5915 domain-containing protein, partial [Bacteroidota bacterium]|nr:DUF5915 domain-containing protein [Bacteroidota bacterium]
LNKIMIPILNPHIKHQIAAVEELIKSEVNVKTIEFIEDTTGIVTKKVKPNFQTLGKTYGKYLKDISARIAQLSQEEINAIEKGKTLDFNLQGDQFSITKLDLLISTEDIEGWAVATENDITVALDIHLSEELTNEGIARDFVNRVQNYRKDNQFEVTDKIKIEVQSRGNGSDKALDIFKEYIKTETQALSLEFKSSITNPAVFDMEGFQLHVQIEKI